MKGVKKTVQELLIGGITVLVILQERVLSDDAAKGFVTLNSGKNVDYDFLVHCGGQKPPSQFLTNLSPESINESGHLRVKGTMQLVDETLPNIYACGDITNIGTRNPNSRITMQQAKIAADNIVTVASGKQPRYKYTPHWAEAVIKLTLGLDKSITHFGNSTTKLLFPGVETDLALMAAGSWKHWHVEPYEDQTKSEGAADNEAKVGRIPKA